MGLTWIVGIFVFDHDHEVPALDLLSTIMSYIFNIFVAFQGVAIFVLFVLCDKPVREAYSKWWRGKVTRSDRLLGDQSLTNLKVSH